MTNIPRPTDAELEIMHVLWARGPSTVREVNDALSAELRREVGYTTTLKMMQLMAEKGLLRRDTAQRTHVYAATVEEQSVQQGLLQRFVDTAFRGSAAQLVLEALGRHRASDEELAAIKQLIADMEQASTPTDDPQKPSL